MIKYLLLMVFAVADAANLTVQMPDGCTPVLNGTAVTCSGSPPPAVCTPPQTGTPPNCVNPLPPPTGDCSSFSKVISLTMNWAAPQTAYSSGMGPNDVVVLQFTTGLLTNPNQYGNVTGAEYQSEPSSRIFALSTKQCDFSNGLGAGAAGQSNTSTVNYSVGSNGSGYYPALAPNTTYFFNVKNAPNSTCAGSGNCNMYYQLHKPPNT